MKVVDLPIGFGIAIDCFCFLFQKLKMIKLRRSKMLTPILKPSIIFLFLVLLSSATKTRHAFSSE